MIPYTVQIVVIVLYSLRRTYVQTQTKKEERNNNKYLINLNESLKFR